MPLMDVLNEIAVRFGIELIVQFASTTKGRERAESDLDVAVWRWRGFPRRA